jgi:ABC-type nitrate/sulfonate/bicarbonate transport system permease component
MIADHEALGTAREDGRSSLRRVTRALFAAHRGWVGALLIAALWWELIARSGLFPPLFMPTIGEILGAFWDSLTSGLMSAAVVPTLSRLLVGFGIAALIGVAVGLVMGTFRLPEEFLLPLVNFLLPIPAIAWIPLFMLWFGLGNRSILPLIILSAALPITVNAWTGVKTVDPVLLRAARGMNVNGSRLFLKVVIPGALPLLMVGFRIGFAQGWRAVIAGELVASAASGLGVMIFQAKQFLNIPLMLAALVVIGVLSLVLEKLVFSRIEAMTLGRWGLMRTAGAA